MRSSQDNRIEDSGLQFQIDDVRVTQIIQKYEDVVHRVNQGSNFANAIADAGLIGWKFERTRTIAEAVLADKKSFSLALSKLTRSNLDNIKYISEDILRKKSSRSRLIDYAAMGRALRPS